MRKRLLAVLMAVMFCLLGTITDDFNVYAEDTAENIEFSQLVTEDAIVGYMQLQTRGVYLSQGFSVINNAGGGKIGCGGTTIAAVKCRVSVNSVVERKVNGSRTRVTSWTTTNASAYSASVSKTLSVGSGYYYRVRSIHTAGSDGSSSYTDGLWM